MKLEDIVNLSKVEDLIPTKDFINSYIDLEEIDYSKLFNGSFEAIYSAIKKGIIKPIIQTEQISNMLCDIISYDINCNDIEKTTKIKNAFQAAYNDKPVENYIQLAASLIDAGLEANKIVEANNGIIYAYILDKGIIVDNNGLTIVKVFKSDYSSTEELKKALDEELTLYLLTNDLDNADTEMNNNLDLFEFTVDELPTTVSIPKCILVEIDEKTIRNYLRKMYGYYLAGDMKALDYTVGDFEVVINDIKWGRKI